MEDIQPTPRPKIKEPSKDDPCRSKRIDFEICQRKLGFNDKVCRCNGFFDVVYLNEFEQCIQRQPH